MQYYSTDFKYEVVRLVVEDNYSKAEIARRYGLHRRLVQRWVSSYLDEGIKGLESRSVKNQYSGEFKLEVVEDMRKNKLSLSETMTKYNIPSDSTLREWERKYIEEGPENFINPIRVKKAIKLDTVIEEDLIAENQRLRMENDYLKKLNALIQEKRK